MKDEMKEYPKEQQRLKGYLDNVSIEQIIDKLKDADGMTWWVDYKDKYQPCWKKLYTKEISLLLDYITNLQESEAYYYGQYKDYKSRNEKAIKYINRYKECEEHSELPCYETYYKDLDIILNGGDKDE